MAGYSYKKVMYRPGYEDVAKRWVEEETATYGDLEGDTGYEADYNGSGWLVVAKWLDEKDAEIAALQTELSRWRKSFGGHVYVKNEEYSALVSERDALKSEADALRVQVPDLTASVERHQVWLTQKSNEKVEAIRERDAAADKARQFADAALKNGKALLAAEAKLNALLATLQRLIDAASDRVCEEDDVLLDALAAARAVVTPAKENP